MSAANAQDLERELAWFSRVLDARVRSYFASHEPAPAGLDEPPPELGASRSPYARCVSEHDLSRDERLVLALAIAPHARPQLLDVLLTKNDATERSFSEFGGARVGAHGGFLPTGETALFLLAGSDLTARFGAMRCIDLASRLSALRVLELAPAQPGEPPAAGLLALTPEFVARFTHGAPQPPEASFEFPARRVATELAWEQLVLPALAQSQLLEIDAWVRHSRTLLVDWGMRAKLRPGFLSLFHGPPGTGKTLSACLIGKRCGRDVYRIDLSRVVSKFIGETEKNLSRAFTQAEREGWILFFDEADALFGRRTRVEDSHDRFANQEVSYLLQRVEEFAGVAILASNFKTNIDDAFLRRFDSLIHFPMPDAAERARLWRGAFSEKSRLEARVELDLIAERFELAGGAIMNVVRYASLAALSRGEDTLRLEDLLEGVRRELHKEGRSL